MAVLLTLRGSMDKGLRRGRIPPSGAALLVVCLIRELRRGDLVGDVDQRAQMHAHAFGQHGGLGAWRARRPRREPDPRERLLVLDGPVDLAAVGGSGGDGDIENLRGALGRDFYRPLLREGELVRLAVGAVEPLPLAANRASGMPACLRASTMSFEVWAPAA